MKILIVEDQSILALTLQSRLNKLGYDSDIVKSGEEAIEKSKNYGLVLMDIDLGDGIDGIQAGTEIIKKYDVPVAYLTSYTDKETKQRAMSTNPVDYLNKPAKINRLEKLLQEFCNLS